MFLALAAIRAVVRETRGERGWEKTEHTGAHRTAESAPLPDLAAETAVVRKAAA